MYLFGDKMTEMFDYLFKDEKDSVILLENGKGIIKKNQRASEFFTHLLKEDPTALMDKSCTEIWRNFLRDATVLNQANCRICLLDSENQKKYFEVQGCYNSTSDQFIIRFKQTQKQFVSQHNSNELIKYEFLFNNAPDGMVLINTEGIIIDANNKVESFFNVTPEDLIGKNSAIMYEFIPQARIETKKFLETLFNRGNAQMILTKTDENGEQRFYHFSSVLDRNLEMYMTVIRDETENCSLKKQIEHSQSLSTLGQIAASIAHEIRNPMTSMKGFGQLLTQHVTEQGRQYLDIVNSELTRMESILNEFLVLSKPPTKSFKFISISSIISQIVNFMQPQATLENIQLVYVLREKETDLIFGDDYELKKVFMNVLKNCIEVMPEGGKVTITQTLHRGSQVCISIKDQGWGMSQEQLHKIFLPFYTSKKQGTGLGLAHAFQTIENHEGSIEVESEISKGTTFHIILPIYQLNASKEKISHDQRRTDSFREVISTNR